MTGFGASAPAETLYREFGITADAVTKAALRCIARARMAASYPRRPAHEQ
jgi:transketolase